ncbi:MAG TPA: VanZ family protein [Thermoanaerobaculia bacterium]|nr:VanZ family protein [Thermoanaerobaculia bacterium]
MRVLLRWMAVAAWAAVILAAADESFSAESSGGWFRRLFGFDVPYALHILIRKLAHVVEYAVLGALALYAARASFTRAATIAMTIALAVAAADEWRQSLSPMRTGSAWDVLLDLAGAALGAWLLGAFPAALRRRL